jgi:hypothetical protein
MPIRRRLARRSWFARNRDLAVLGVMILPMVHWSIKPPKS